MNVIAFASGKGGVGKSVLALNIAACLAARGLRVVLLDGNFALGSLDVLLGMTPKFHVGHLFLEEKSIQDIMICCPSCGFSLIPASSGLVNVEEVSEGKLRSLATALRKLEHETDYLLVDCAPGIGRIVAFLVNFASQVVVVTEPEPTAILGSYALIKGLTQAEHLVRVVVNKVQSLAEGVEVTEQISTVVERFLEREVVYGGSVRSDDSVRQSVMACSLLVEGFPNSNATRDIKHIADSLVTPGKHCPRGVADPPTFNLTCKVQ